MISDYLIAVYVQAVYDGQRGPFLKYVESDASKICWALLDLGSGYHLLILRGSATRLDWERDFYAIANPFSHDVLGPVHPGFHIGMSDLAQQITAMGVDPDKLIIAGHSLGAGRACILTGIFVAAGHKPLRRVCFGEPRPGFAKLASLVNQVPATSYRNALVGDKALEHDLVTDAPLKTLIERYVHPVALTDVYCKPNDSERDKLGVFAWHHMPLYLQALKERL